MISDPPAAGRFMIFDKPKTDYSQPTPTSDFQLPTTNTFPMKIFAVDLHYLPNLEFFAAISGADELLVFPEDRYQRQSYLNRTQIRLANKVETLSVPIQGRRPKIPMEKVLIDYSQNWQSVHLRGMQSAYGKAPFFEYFFPYLKDAISKNHPTLWDLNWEMLTICLKLLQSNVKLVKSESTTDWTQVGDIRGQIEPSTSFSSRNYYQPADYCQLFGLDFEPNLSIIDLLFCEGPAAKNIILKSVKKQ